MKILRFGLVGLVLSCLVASGMAIQGYDGPRDGPHVTSQPGDVGPGVDVPTVPGSNSTFLDKGLSGVLPADASPRAKSVLNTIDGVFAGLQSGFGQVLGDLLGNQTVLNNSVNN